MQKTLLKARLNNFFNNSNYDFICFWFGLENFSNNYLSFHKNGLIKEKFSET